MTPELAMWTENTAGEKPVLLNLKKPREFQACPIDRWLTMPTNLIPNTRSKLAAEQTFRQW
jgi:hypothetical protein